MPRIIPVEGAWGAGKTTILDALGENTKVVSSVVPHARRLLGRANTKNLLANPVEFSAACFEIRTAQILEAATQQREQWFDRTLFSPIVLRTLAGVDVPIEYLERIADFKRQGIIPSWVVVVDPIPFGLHKNGWRKSFSYADSLKYHQVLCDLLGKLNFKVLHIPFGSVPKRVQDIRAAVSTLLGDGLPRVEA
jgi:predicted ATPase